MGNKPRIRFKGFTEDWEQRKLNDFVIIRRGLTYKPSDIAENGIRVLRSSNIDEDQFITSNDDVFVNKDAVNIPFAKNGDILITSANGSNRLVGKHTIISDIAENSTVHGGFMLLAESKNPLFTDALLSSNWYKRFINTYVAGGNGAIGNLSKSDLENQTVVVPSEHEQAKIGQWYDNINQLITLHQCKLEKLKLTKKALLQKLFPKNGKHIPEIRFKGFTDAWEQCKLGEFVNIVSGDAPSTFISGNCIYVKVDDLNYSDRIQLSSSNLVNANPKAHLVNTGATIFPKRGAAIMTNKVRIMGQDGYLDTNMMALIPKEIDKDFLFTFIQKTGLYKISDTSTIPQINNKHIEPYMIQVPTNKEQECIGVFFEKIDKIITLHQRKLERLQEVKKGLLQKMFV